MVRTPSPPASTHAQLGSASSPSEQYLLAEFHKFRVGPGSILCFFGQILEQHRRTLAQMVEQGLLVKERFPGAYSLTAAGFNKMRAQCTAVAQAARTSRRLKAR